MLRSVVWAAHVWMDGRTRVNISLRKCGGWLNGWGGGGSGA